MTSHNAESGAQRAAGVSESMLGVPGYADDSMFFTVRYGAKVKQTLRTCDWDEFQKTIGEITQIWLRSGRLGDGGQSLPVEQRYARLNELRMHCLDLVKAFPDLTRDFDRFLDSSKAAIAASLRAPGK